MREQLELGALGGVQALSALAPNVLAEVDAVADVGDADELLAVLGNSRVEVSHEL